jgi:hypothetical protein
MGYSVPALKYLGQRVERSFVKKAGYKGYIRLSQNVSYVRPKGRQRI